MSWIAHDTAKIGPFLENKVFKKWINQVTTIMINVQLIQYSKNILRLIKSIVNMKLWGRKLEFGHSGQLQK